MNQATGKRSWLAVTLLAVGVLGIGFIWFGFGSNQGEHAHSQQSSIIAGGGSAAATPAPTVVVGTAAAATTAPADPAAAGEHAGHESGGGTSPAVVSDSTPTPTPAVAAPDAVDPDAPAADRRQISLGEAAGDGSVPSTTAVVPVANRWLDPEAAGVNDGSKQQAADVTLEPAPVVDPSQVLPHGLANGCVPGYGQGGGCLPSTPPSHAGHGTGEDMSIYWTCAEVRTVLPNGIPLDNAGTDPLGLDSNGDGTACGAGDQ
jgi:hypothetical protein